MANLKKSVLGKVSGAVGDLVFRIRNKNNIVAVRPISFIPGTDAKSVNRRSRFGIAVRFSFSANKISFLKNLWRKRIPSDSLVTGAIMKHTYPYVTHSEVSSAVNIVPDIGFEIENPVVTLSNLEAKLVSDPLGSGTEIDPVVEPNLVMVGVVFLSDRKSDTYKLNEFISFSSSKVPTSLVNPLSFSHAMNDVHKQLIDRYNSAKCFLAVLSLDADDVPVHFSNTLFHS